MMKAFISIAVASFVITAAAVALADPVLSVPLPGGYLDAQYFAGSGPNTAYFVVDFNGKPGGGGVYGFGYRWCGTQTADNAMLAIDAAGALDMTYSDFGSPGQPNIFINRLTYPPDTDEPDFSVDGRFWNYFLGTHNGTTVNWTPSNYGISGRDFNTGDVVQTLVDGGLNGFYASADGTPPRLPVVAVPTWTGAAGDGKWSTAGNWTIVPAAGSSLVFSGGLSPIPMNDSALSNVGGIGFDSTASPITLGGTGTGTSITLARGIVNNSANTQTVNLNLTLTAEQQFNAAAGNLVVAGSVDTGGNVLDVTGVANTTLAGAISGTGSLDKGGMGILALTARNSYSGGTEVCGGTLVVGHARALGTGGLTINAGTAKLQSGLSAPVQLPSLTIAGGASPAGKLDLSDNAIVVHNGDLAATLAQAKSGLNASGALWSGSGITSSTAASDAAAHSNATAFAVGVIQNVDKNGAAIYATWPATAGANAATGLTTSDVLMKYTYFGDADLNGVVDNTADYDLWSNGFTNPSLAATNGWLYGDFDYSGTVDNTTDYDLWSTGFVHQGAALAGSPGSEIPATAVQSVPEPAAISLAAFGIALLSCWRKQSHATRSAIKIGRNVNIHDSANCRAIHSLCRKSVECSFAVAGGKDIQSCDHSRKNHRCLPHNSCRLGSSCYWACLAVGTSRNRELREHFSGHCHNWIRHRPVCTMVPDSPRIRNKRRKGCGNSCRQHCHRAICVVPPCDCIAHVGNRSLRGANRGNGANHCRLPFGCHMPELWHHLRREAW
jgi:autotransporter-associated beta strand protein